jgi:hypothetical protein
MKTQTTSATTSTRVASEPASVAVNPKLVQLIERAVMKELDRAVTVQANRHIFSPLDGSKTVHVQPSLLDALFAPYATLKGFRLDAQQLPALQAAVNQELASSGYHASIRVDGDNGQLVLDVRGPAYLQKFMPEHLTDADRAFLVAHPRQ